MKIELPSIQAQQRFIIETATKEAIDQLIENLKAPTLPPQTDINEDQYPRTHLLREAEGWQAPHPDVIRAYFRHFQAHFPEYDSDAKLAKLLGLSDSRRIRAYINDEKKIPYGIWRRFLVLTGRAPQEIIKILAYMG